MPSDYEWQTILGRQPHRQHSWYVDRGPYWSREYYRPIQEVAEQYGYKYTGARPDIQVDKKAIEELRKHFKKTPPGEKVSDGKMKWKIQDAGNNSVTQSCGGNVCISIKEKSFNKDTWKEFKQMVDELLDISEEAYESTTK